VGSTGSTGTAGTNGLTGATGLSLAGSTGATGVGIAGPTGAGGARGYYGSFWDTTDQTAAAANTAYAMKVNTSDGYFGVHIENDGSSNPTHVVLENPGTYCIEFSAQLYENSGSPQVIDIWLRANGTNVPDSAGIVTVQGTLAQEMAAWNFFYTSTVANEYLQIMFSVSNISVYINKVDATAVVPLSPSVTITVSQIMNTQLGATGATGSIGSVGTTGATGLSIVGTTGATGNAGSTGTTGAVGTNGIGVTGLQGSTGATGSAGTRGSTGSTGTAGTNGIGVTGIGSTGATGVPARTYTQNFSGSNDVNTSNVSLVTSGTYSLTSGAFITYSGYIFHPSGGGAHNITFNLMSNSNSIVNSTYIISLPSGSYGNMSFSYLDSSVSGSRYYTVRAISTGPVTVSNSTLIVNYL
jgi:hypothetical protein